MKKVAVFGSFVVDLMARSPHLPVPGETVKGSMFKMGPGGKGFNQCVAAHKAGADVVMMTKIGTDTFANVMLDTMTELNMPKDNIFITKETETGIALILVDENSSQNEIIIVPGACNTITAEEVASVENVIKECEYVLLQLEVNQDANEMIVDMANKYGCKVIMNTAPYAPMTDEFLSKCYMVTPNEVEAEEITGVEVKDLDSAKQAAAYLIAELAKRKIKVVFCDEKRNPSCELVNYYGSHDTSNKIRKQIAWKQNTKEAVWTEIVTEKIRKQKELLELLGKEESGLLGSYLREIAWNDGTNREGHAAKVYFNALFGLDFTRTEDNVINAALNYGYSIILSAFTREVVMNGYITQLGIFHDNMFNQFNLASDLMEPFRVLVDRQVLAMPLEEFEHEEKMQFVNILNQEVQIDGKVQYVNNAIKIYCKSIFDALNEDDSALIRFYRIEL